MSIIKIYINKFYIYSHLLVLMRNILPTLKIFLDDKKRTFPIDFDKATQTFMLHSEIGACEIKLMRAS